MPRERIADRVHVVVIDDRALATYGQWPWPRSRVAELVARIAEGKPLVLGMDLFFPEPDRYSGAALARAMAAFSPEIAAVLARMPSNDAALGAALKSVPSVLGIAGLQAPDTRFPGPPRAPVARFLDGAGESIRRYPGHLRNVQEIDAAAAGHGLISIDFEGGVARRMQLVGKFDEATVPALAVEMIRVAVGGLLTVAPLAGGRIELRFGDYAVPAQADGRAYLHFGASNPGRFIAASDILAGTFDVSQLADQFVLVGFTGLGLQDLVATPLGETVFGVENHAQLVESILEGRFLGRIEYANRIEAMVLIVFGFALFIVIPRTNALRSSALLVGGIAILVGGGLVAFRYAGLLFDPIGPALGAMFAFGAMQAGSLAEVQHQRLLLRDQAARMAGEMGAAKRIQMGLLPDPREVLKSERRVDVAALLEPARTVGGDFYDCFMLDGNRLFFVVADVSGKGLPASLFMASTKSILKSAALTATGTVGSILAGAQEEIRRENPESLFVTALAGVLDLETGELEYTNAGHEPVWSHLPRGQPERLASAGGPPLCVLDDFDYPSTRRSLVPGEWLLALSDGATEAMNPAKEFFGLERLRTSLAWLGDESDARAIIRRVRDDVRRFSGDAEPADDLTLLAIRWGSEAAGVSAR